MADPLTILMFTNASLGIARSLVHTIKELYELAEAYETAALGIRTVATQCNSFRIAVQRISKWLQTQNEESKHDLDEDFWSALNENLETARMVMDDLDKRIAGLKKTPAKFWTRTKYLWNGVVISELQTQIGGLMSAVSILIQVIDIPTTGGKRSYSLAQRNRLNTITKSVRHNEEQRAQIRARQEQNLLDEPIPNNENLVQPDQPQTTGPEMQQRTPTQPDTRSQPSFNDLAIPDIAPPSYETLDGVDSSTATAIDDKKSRKKSSGDEKSKRGFWKNMKMTRPKPASTSSFGSMFSSSKSPPPETNTASDSTPDTLSRTTSETPNLTPQISQTNTAGPNMNISQLHETPAPIKADGDKEYFQLQSAMSGMGMTSRDLSSTEKDSSKPDLSPRLAELHSSPTAQQTSSTLFQQQPQSYNPYAPKLTNPPSESTHQSFTRTKSTYLDEIVPTSQKFERLRPSQRVKDARDERSRSPNPNSHSGDTAVSSIPDSAATTTTSTRLGSFTLPSSGSFSGGGSGSSSNHTQKWTTCPMPSRSVNFTVQFEDESFTNKMSAAAARVLGVDDHIVEYAGIPITSLTMLHTVEDECVAGDEVEFVVMGEHEQRTPLLVLGAGMAHLRRMMTEGEYIYWDSQPVPEKLRTKERLRLYRRFELVRW